MLSKSTKNAEFSYFLLEPSSEQNQDIEIS